MCACVCGRGSARDKIFRCACVRKKPKDTEIHTYTNTPKSTMLKSLALVVVLLAGGVTAADGVAEQDQIYIVAGVLGGVCLLLTIATIFTTLAITKLQTQVAVLQAGSSRPAPHDNRDISQPDLHQKPPPQMGLPRSEGLPRIDRPARSEGVTRYNSGQPEDPYRAPPRERENIRMQGFNPTHYYDNMGYEMSGPAPPPRPYRGPAAARDNYY
ncbi:uncharacterized protein LOC127008357 isoform X2 [Eriocheir sinensis]|uniref:uncharacterized protein LOC127008357 isoform X2 n=1 Tax=Eriocheir sinensis TaxID=95602 RepID=UPI0021C7A360|nr:uncharacterized protein LOC127008357 isoform X2 [Eriocheir sinensis]